jgi:hypothetical protein
MPAVGKVTVKKVKGILVYKDETGRSFSFPRTTGRSLMLDIDPRIDLTKPIYEQAMKLQAKDKAAVSKARKRKARIAVA